MRQETLSRLAAEVTALLSAGDPLDEPAKLNAAVDAMRAQGLGSAMIVDGLIGTYCPIVAANASLTDAQKASLVQGFAARITRLVYAFPGADEIILDVPFSATAVDAINSKAAEAGMSAEAWIANTVDAALAAQP